MAEYRYAQDALHDSCESYQNVLVKNSLNARCFPKNYEVNNEPSMTIPDQAMTMREILDRFAVGLPLDVGKVGMYDEEDDMPDLRTLDLAERQEYAEMFAEELKEIDERVSKSKKPKKSNEKETSNAETAEPGEAAEPGSSPLA